MDKKTVAVIVIAAGIAYIVWRNNRPAQERNINQLVPTPEQDANWWAIMAGQTPSLAGSNGAGEVNPVTKLIGGLAAAFRGESAAWSAPNAGTGPFVPSNGPAGLSVPGQPVSPGQPTPQSAVSSSSPYLSPNLALPVPLQMNPWIGQLSMSNPIAAFQYGGASYIDVRPELS